jgi:signal transduction histidine kinase
MHGSIPSSSGPAPAALGPHVSHLTSARILIVDDELANIRVLERLLQRAGVTNYRSTTDPREAAPLLAEFGPDIVLLDLHMPHLDGLAVIRQFRTLVDPETFLPIVILTADATPATKLRSLESGATDFLTKPLDTAEVLLRVRNLLHTRRLHLELAEHNAHLEETVRARTADLRAALTELQTTQSHLVQQERLSAFGTMAGGVAHDFNNALSMILGYSELLLATEDEIDSEERQEYVRTIITAAKDSARMISRLREFYRPNDGKEVWEHVDFGQLLREAMSLTEPKWKNQCEHRGISVAIKLDTQPVPSVSGNSAELREMLTNLIFNAVDAMPSGGAIHLRARPEAGHVVVEVADTGTGMSEEVRQRCLEPFFTTKGDKGTGLGLAMVYGIIQRHHAEMYLESAVGVGTTFRFVFKAEHDGTGEENAPAIRLAHPLKILVVDDQPFICEIMVQYLAQDCHVAEAAGGGEIALERIAGQKFDLMITDQAMPDMSGGQLAQAAKKIDPELRVILLTGFGAEEKLEAGEESIDLILAKPVSLESMRHGLAAVFGDPPPLVSP